MIKDLQKFVRKDPEFQRGWLGMGTNTHPRAAL